MGSFLRAVVVVAACVACAGSVVGCAPPDLCGDRDVGAVGRVDVVAHAHNDYEHDVPLDDAVGHGFHSVEADVWHRDGAIVVSHDAFSDKGTLQELYLEPLAALLATQDSVVGDGKGFTLWLDLKDGTQELRTLLAEALKDLPFLTVFDDTGVAETRAVTVIVTGDAGSKEALIDEVDAPRVFARDDNDLAVDDDHEGTVVAAALNFGGYLGGWDGNGAVPDDVERNCACVVDKAHRIGRKVRFFGGPDGEASWQFQIDHGVDFINADDLAGLEALMAE